MEVEDKENICQFQKTVVTSNMVSRTPLRTPLHDVNSQSLLKESVKKTILNYVTTSESAPRTPTRKLNKLKRSLLVYKDKENESDENIRTAASREVAKIISNAKHLLIAPTVSIIPATPSTASSTSSDNGEYFSSVDQDLDGESVIGNSETSVPTDSISSSLVFSFDDIENVNSCINDISESDDSDTNNQLINTDNKEETCVTCTVNDLDICFDHEEVYGANTSVNDDICADNSCMDQLSLLAAIHDNKSDHTYAGAECKLCTDKKTNICDLVISPVTPLLKSNVETSTEILSVIDTACSLVHRGSINKETMVEVITNDIGCSPCHSCIAEKETMTNPVTPAKLPLTFDASVQHLIDTVTAACSPLLGDMTTAACSPILSRFTADYNDVGCSPAFNTYTVEISTMTNATPTKHNMALQAVPDTMSVMCSPLHTQTRECGISAVSTQADVTTNTVIVEQLDQGVDVRPMMTAGTTMTEYLLVDNETSMTPVKLLNKKGHRITAEEIRRQHPRTLANKLDTLAMEAERHKQEVERMEKERDRFKAQISELKGTIKEKQKLIDESREISEKESLQLKEHYEEEIKDLNARLQKSEEYSKQIKEEMEEMKVKSKQEIDTYKLEINDLSIKCEDFERQLKESTVQTSKEIEILKEEIEMNRNDHQIRSAHNLILELQTELSEYKELTDSLKLAEKLQGEIQNVMSENYRKVRAAADRLMNMKRGLDVQRIDVVQQKCDIEKEAERLEVEKKEMTEKYDNLTIALETSRSSMMQIESLYESTSADLLSATNQVQILSKELITTKSALEESYLTKSTLIQQVEDLQENDKAAVLEISNLRQVLHGKQSEFEEFRKWSTDKENNLSAKIDMLKDEKKRLDLLVVNLQRTVDSLNEDIDTLENDLFATREFSTEQASRIVQLDEELATTGQDLVQIRQENMELRDSLAVFRGNQDYLQETIAATQRELQKKSHELNLQNAEIQDSTVLVVELENKMAGLLQGLRSRAGLEPAVKASLNSPKSTSKHMLDQSTKKSAKKNKDSDLPHSCRKVQDKSFLSMVIKAAEGPSDSEYESCKSSPSSKSSRSVSPYIDGVVPLDEEISTICEKLKDSDSMEESPGALSRNMLGFSRRNSAFAPVRTGTSVIKSKPGPLDSTIKNVSVMSQSQLEDCNLRLSEQIDSMGEMFTEIIRCASIIEKASRLSISDLQLENEELSEQLYVCQTAERATNAELAMKISQFKEAEDTIATMTGNITSLSEKIGFYVKQEAELNNLKSEIISTRSQLEQHEAEKQILSNQLKEVLNSVKGESTLSGNFARYHSDITTLKLKIQKLKEQLKQREEYHEALAVKASKRMQTLDENWKKAEEEVYKFDQLVDNIRETLISSGLIPKHKESLGRIIRMIDGFESVPSKPAPLNPVKTALW